jgi:hypothetical protein
MAAKLKVDQVESVDGSSNITINNSVTMAANQTLPAASLTGALPAISGASVTSLNATNLGSGTVPTARLGSGTASSSVFLSGAGTWATAGSTSASDLTSGTLPIARIADDAITLAKMAPGTDGNIISYDASGNPVAIATGSDGQVLTSTGAGSPPAFEALPAGGLSESDSWNLTANFTPGSGQQYITSNLARSNETGFGLLGTGMSQSSGVFTFPSTGIWEVLYHIIILNTSISGYIHTNIQTTTDGSTWQSATNEFGSVPVGGHYAGLWCVCQLDVTNTSTHKCRFGHYIYVPQNATVLAAGSGVTNANYTFMTFKKLGDT